VLDLPQAGRSQEAVGRARPDRVRSRRVRAPSLFGEGQSSHRPVHSVVADRTRSRFRPDLHPCWTARCGTSAARPFGLDERGGSSPSCSCGCRYSSALSHRKGKTFSARLLALFAALDPWVRIDVVDGKNSPDWRSFALVAHTMIYGTVPTQDADPVDQLLTLLREIEAHVTKVNRCSVGLCPSTCAQGKLTWRSHATPIPLPGWMPSWRNSKGTTHWRTKMRRWKIAKLLSTINRVARPPGSSCLSASQNRPASERIGNPKLFTRFQGQSHGPFRAPRGNRTVFRSGLGGDA